MDSFDILRPGPWFGPKSGQPEQGGHSESMDEKAVLLRLCDKLKSGDFSARSELEYFIGTCPNSSLRRQAIRLFCFVARHQDIPFLGRLLEKSEHEEILTVVVTAPCTLSPEIVPYLLVLLERYVGTSLQEDILSSINTLFPFGYGDGEEDLPKLSVRFSAFASSLEPGGYYHEGLPSHPGRLTKKLVESAADSRHRKVKFPLANIPTLLSVWSGEKCPVSYGQFVDEAAFQSVLDYVGRIASLSWNKGGKYFYREHVL